MDGGPLVCWFPGGSAVTRVDLLRPVGWDLGETKTAAAKAAENARIKKIVDETGKVRSGNEKSYRP